ncbi:hypothetical protein Hanom_Chr01g00002231 [Helianthus anomalus]
MLLHDVGLKFFQHRTFWLGILIDIHRYHFSFLEPNFFIRNSDFLIRQSDLLA